MRQNRLARLTNRLRFVPLLAAVGIVTFGTVRLYDMAKPEPHRLTQRDIDAAVGKALESATPKPSLASQVYQVIRPSLVRIATTGSGEDQPAEGGLGTGVVIDEAGSILTSLHVVASASTVHVTFADGLETEASVVVRQPQNDLAVLRPDVVPDDVLPATFTSSGTLRVGDEIVVVGNPFGITNSLSAGVVSGLRRNYRSLRTGESLTNLIQFDAAVNPGNSGGPLLNRDGEVVGIVTALLNPTEQEVFIGIGFAVPIETAASAIGSPPY